jgi:hypothetical protein
MTQKNQTILVRGADGAEKELILLYISGSTAYACARSRHLEAVDNPDFAVGFPMKDVRFLKDGEAAN